MIARLKSFVVHDFPQAVIWGTCFAVASCVTIDLKGPPPAPSPLIQPVPQPVPLPYPLPIPTPTPSPCPGPGPCPPQPWRPKLEAGRLPLCPCGPSCPCGPNCRCNDRHNDILDMIDIVNKMNRKVDDMTQKLTQKQHH